MKLTILAATVVFLIFLCIGKQDTCSYAQSLGSGPKRLVIIKGMATILNHPVLGATPFSGGTLIFQKAGCDSCFIATHADATGRYEITVGDGRYKVLVRNPSNPDFDMLVPGQEQIIDTETDVAKMYSKQVFEFDVKVRLPN